MKYKFLILSVLASLALTGCATKERIIWNNYQDNLYDFYSQKLTDEEYIATLLEAVQTSQEQGIPLAPGLFAEIGTFYARAGKFADAISYYKLEAQTWPESKPFMDKLVAGIEAHLARKKENQK